MSVSFSTDGPMVTTPVRELYPNLDESDFEDFRQWGYPVNEAGELCQLVPDYPQFSVTQTSASILLRLAGMAHLNPADGHLDGLALSRFLQGLMVARNGRAPAAEVAPFTVNGNVISGGYSLDRIQRLLDQGIGLAQYCQRHKLPLYWA
mgnify:CR=1 FL=1